MINSWIKVSSVFERNLQTDPANFSPPISGQLDYLLTTVSFLQFAASKNLQKIQPSRSHSSSLWLPILSSNRSSRSHSSSFWLPILSSYWSSRSHSSIQSVASRIFQQMIQQVSFLQIVASSLVFQQIQQVSILQFAASNLVFQQIQRVSFLQFAVSKNLQKIQQVQEVFLPSGLISSIRKFNDKSQEEQWKRWM